jgi:YYY domain-containing protein
MIALASLIVNRYRLALLIPLFLVNPSFIYQVILGKGLSAVIWDSTRTIANTINEYPIFSFVWGDVHAHVVGMFNQVFIIFLLVFAYIKWNTLESRARGIVISLCILSLGSMPLINSWDVLVYAPITLLFGILIWWKNRNEAKAKRSALVFLLAIPVISIILYLPFYIQMKTQGVGGLFIVATPSDPLQFLLVHGFFLAVFYVIIGQDIIKRPYLLLIVIPFLLTGFYAAAVAVVPLAFFAARKDLRPEELLAVLGLAITIFCEIFYLRDNMGETYFRMNTVFKFYISAWLLMGAASCAMAADWLGRQKIPSVINSHSRDILITGTIILFIIPLVVPFNYNYEGYTLDGLAYLEKAHPGDSAAVSYLRSLPGNDFCLVEAEGGDYQYYSRISSFTGIPAITGMPFHEVMWRGNKDNWYGERVSDIRMIYEKPDRTVPLMKKYNCSYLIVGDPERERYTVSILADAFDNVFSRQGTTIYRIRS